MGVIQHCGVLSRAQFKRIFSISLLAGLSFSLFSCSYLEGLEDSSASSDDSSYSASQEQLLAELERNQILWAQAGVTEYSYSVHKECDCPEEILTAQEIEFAVQDAEDAEDSDEFGDANDEVSAAKSKTRGKLRARDDDEQRRTAQSQSFESVFSDLRRAIQANAVQQVSYDPRFGYPQNVTLNTAAYNQPLLFGQPVQTRNSDDDDDRRAVSPLTIQTRNFQAFNTVAVPQGRTFSGQLVRNSDDDDNNWLVTNDGQWRQLAIPNNLRTTVNNLPNRSFVDLDGNWRPGGVTGQGFINVGQVSPRQINPFQNNLSGTLFYSVANNDDYDLDDFYVTNDRGQNIFLNVPSNLQSRAFQLAGQRVNLSGNWIGQFNDANSRFKPTKFNSQFNSLQRFTGYLTNANTYPIPGVQTSNMLLVTDTGASLELQIPANVVTNTSYLIGQRVEVYGTPTYSGNFGQQVIYVQSVNPLQNNFTNSTVTGTIVSLSTPGGFSVNDMIQVQLNTGNTITVQISAQFRDPYNALAVGMQVQINGIWINDPVFGQGVLQAQAPLQIINYGYTTATTYTGYVSGVGSFGNGVSCNGSQTTYNFTTDQGQTFQLYVTNSTLIDGQNGLTTLPYQSRIQVSGVMLSPGILQAQNVTVYQQAQTTIYGTIVEIGAAGSTYNCTGTLSSYRVLDQLGNYYSVTTTPNSIVQGSIGGGYLRIGDVVQITGSMSANGSSFYASRINVSNTAPIPQPYPYPIPPPVVNNNVSLMGTVTGLDCSDGNSETYVFVDDSGALYHVRVDNSLMGGSYWIDVGTQLQVTGTYNNGEIYAQSVNQVNTFVDPLIRTPINGTIVSLIDTTPTCNSPTYTYQFQSDTGQIYQLRLTYETQRHQDLPIANGTALTVTSRLYSANPQLIDAMEIQYYVANQPFYSGNNGYATTLSGNLTKNICGNSFYFVDQNGNGYEVQNSQSFGASYVTAPSRATVSGQVIGNRISNANIVPDNLPVYLPPPPPVTGTIMSVDSTEILSCGATVSLYTIQNDLQGRTQRLRVVNDTFNPTGSYLGQGSRVYISQHVESFNGSMIDAIQISQQGYF